MDTLTSTATKAVSGTKLFIATMAMMGAGAVALATVPLNNMIPNSSTGSNDVAVQTCQQMADGVNVSVTGINRGVSFRLINGCNDAGHGLLNYTYVCKPAARTFQVTSSSLQTPISYVISWKPCEEAKCTDSDGGRNNNVQGTVVFSKGPNYGYTATDSCQTGNNSVLIEQYCENNIGKTEFITCQNGCQNGACLKETPSAVSLMINNNYPDGFKLSNGVNRVSAYSFASVPAGNEVQLNDLSITVNYGNVAMTDWYLTDDNAVKIASGVVVPITTTTIRVDFKQINYLLTGKILSAYAKLNFSGSGSFGTFTTMIKDKESVNASNLKTGGKVDVGYTTFPVIGGTAIIK